jgi:hypothetical protein
MKLLESDGHAVDLYLDRGQSSAVREGGPGYAASSGQVSQRVRQVETLLNLLDELPVEEPPSDLLARTLERIEEISPHGLAAPGAPGLIDPHHPMA